MADTSTPGPDERGGPPVPQGASPDRSSSPDTTPIPSGDHPTAALPVTGAEDPPAPRAPLASGVPAVPGPPPAQGAGGYPPAQPLPPAGATYPLAAAPLPAAAPGAPRPAGRGSMPMLAIVLGAVLVALLALGTGFAGGFLVGNAVGRHNDGPGQMLQGPDWTEHMERSGPGRMGDWDRDGMGLLPRTDPRSGTDELPEPAPTDGKTAPTP